MIYLFFRYYSAASKKWSLRCFIIPNVLNRFTPKTFWSWSSQIANCLFLGSCSSLSLITAHSFLTTSWRGITSDPTTSANSADNLNDFVNADFFPRLPPPDFFFFFPQSPSESSSSAALRFLGLGFGFRAGFLALGSKSSSLSSSSTSSSEAESSFFGGASSSDASSSLCEFT